MAAGRGGAGVTGTDLRIAPGELHAAPCASRHQAASRYPFPPNRNLSAWCRRLLLALVTLTPIGSAQAGALGQGDWLLRGLVLGSHATQVHSTISTIGGEVEIASYVQPGADLSYFLNERWALQFTGGISRTHYRIRDSLIGDFDVGRVDSYSGTLSLQYHFSPWGALTPYLGAGLYHAQERRRTRGRHSRLFGRAGHRPPAGGRCRLSCEW
ncbi:OmpW family outer membrane protein [Salinicola tamaricis]|uniref:OmpW/AlkL family protein n=1 Tax=Salinicola tamaricis TaxID=1771309 RepID=UPI000D0A3430